MVNNMLHTGQCRRIHSTAAAVGSQPQLPCSNGARPSSASKACDVMIAPALSRLAITLRSPVEINRSPLAG